MKTEAELNDDILKLIATIKNKFPELAKYIDEMPVTIPALAHPKTDKKALQEYYDSLSELLKNYSLNHNKETE